MELERQKSRKPDLAVDRASSAIHSLRSAVNILESMGVTSPDYMGAIRQLRSLTEAIEAKEGFTSIDLSDFKLMIDGVVDLALGLKHSVIASQTENSRTIFGELPDEDMTHPFERVEEDGKMKALNAEKFVPITTRLREIGKDEILPMIFPRPTGRARSGTSLPRPNPLDV